MALDTRDRRASAIHVGLPWRGLLPLPDVGAEDQEDRQHVGGYYRGVLAGSPVSQAYAEVLWTAITARAPSAGTIRAQQAGVGTIMAYQPSVGTIAQLDED